MRYMIRLVGKAAPGEDDNEHGSHGDYTADDEEPRLGRHRDELTRIRVDRCVIGGVEQPHQQHAAIGVIV